MPAPKGSADGERQPRLPASVCGERVRVALMEARPAGFSTKQLMVATGLSAYDVRKGLLWIKETAALQHLTPLIWSPKEGYRFSAPPATGSPTNAGISTPSSPGSAG
jgi:hypothetical protein